jgi:hypothetical protein
MLMRWCRPMPEKAPRTIKYAWALLLSLSVGAIVVTEKGSPWQPLLNTLIDALQSQMRADPQPLPGAGQIPARLGPLNLPTWEKVLPATPTSGPVAPPNVATTDK